MALTQSRAVLAFILTFLLAPAAFAAEFYVST